jgi:hypothetical protein
MKTLNNFQKFGTDTKSTTGECCLLVLNSVTSTPQWIRQPKAVVVAGDLGTGDTPAGRRRVICMMCV